MVERRQPRRALDVLPLEVLGAFNRLCARLVERIDALPDGVAEQPTRCADWRAVDLVNHLADTTSWATEVTTAAAEQRETTIFAGFHVRRTPKQLTDAQPRDLAAARARLHANIAANLALVPEIVRLGNGLCQTPLGPQPFPVAALHAMWDTWLHERDLLIPLGIDPPQHEDEVRLCALYSLRLLGLFVAMSGQELSVTLRLHGATETTLRLDATPQLTAVRVVDDPTPQLSGDAAAAVDALTGRGDPAALEGPAELRAALSPLRAVLAGR